MLHISIFSNQINTFSNQINNFLKSLVYSDETEHINCVKKIKIMA